MIKLTKISTLSTACNSAINSCNKEGSLREELNNQGVRSPVMGKIPGILDSCIDFKTRRGLAIRSDSIVFFISKRAVFKIVEISCNSA